MLLRVILEFTPNELPSSVSKHYLVHYYQNRTTTHVLQSISNENNHTQSLNELVSFYSN